MVNKATINGNGNIVIQDSDNSEITINTNNPEEIRKFFIDFQEKLNNLPKKIIKLMESKNSISNAIEPSANVYLGLDFLISDSIVSGISFGVTVTNLNKEHRYFNAPFFKSSVPFEGELDTFILIYQLNNIVFPKRLEYGEVFKQSYSLKTQSREQFNKILLIDQEATIQVLVNTTLGEVFMSNEYKISKLIENYKYSR